MQTLAKAHDGLINFLKIISGVMAHTCSQLLKDFFRMRRELAEQILRRRGRHEIPEAVDRRPGTKACRPALPGGHAGDAGVGGDGGGRGARAAGEGVGIRSE